MRALLRKFNARARQRAFKRQQRVDFYRAMFLYQRAGTPKLDALEKISQTYSTYSSAWHRLGNRIYTLLGGKTKPFRPVLVAVADTALLHRNLALADALRDWLPLTERAILAAGERSGKFADTFEMAGRFARQQGGMWSRAITACFYPVVMSLVVMGMLYYFGGTFLPGLDVRNAAMFSPSTQVLVWFSELTYDYWYIAIAIQVVAILIIVASLSRWKGAWRTKADRYPPWSIYRRIHGALFLYGFAVQQGSGVPVQVALANLAMNANPWLRIRISAATYGVREGYNLGRSLRNAGHDFPDWRALPVVESIASLSGSSEALIEYAEHWLNDTSTLIDRFSRGATAFGVIWVALWTLWFALGLLEIIFISFK